MVSSLLSQYNRWYNVTSVGKIDVICMLPNGCCITLPQTPVHVPLADIKVRLWEEAARYPIHRNLLPKENYVFVVVSGKGVSGEVMDEGLSLFDVKPVRPYLKVFKRQGDEDTKRLNSKINMLIGKTSESIMRVGEVEDFRKKFSQACEKVSENRGRASWEKRAAYTYPPEFENENAISIRLDEKLQIMENQIHLSVSVLKNNFVKFKVPFNTPPRKLLEMVLKKKMMNSKAVFEDADDYVLKVHGRLDFLLGQVTYDPRSGREVYEEKPLIQYKYIRECILWDRTIKLLTVRKSNLTVEEAQIMNASEEPPPTPMKRNKSKLKGGICLWDLDESIKFKVKIVAVTNVNPSDMLKEVKCGIYHGGEEVCKTRTTKFTESDRIQEELVFDISVSDMPCMARLCFAIVAYKPRDTKRKKPVTIGWVNMPVFDYKGYLPRKGSLQLYCWQHKVDMKECLNPRGTVASSGDKNTPYILIEFCGFEEERAIQYPPGKDRVADLVAQIASRDNFNLNMQGAKQQHIEIEEIIQRDTLQSFEDDKEKELMWDLRMDCMELYPGCLPKFLQCVNWFNKDCVAQLHHLLTVWETRTRTLGVDVALDLLDYKFPDNNVRTIAVKILDNLSDRELEMYLLQLIQALKYESYLDSPLAKYLLCRAYSNRKIGHYLFWHLKAEVMNPEYSLQFGLMLEFYCRGSKQHIDILTKQVDFIGKLTTMTEVLEMCKDKTKEERLETIKETFQEPSYKKVFSNLISPLDPTVKLKHLKIEKCKEMDSKKKPLWLVFKNQDEDADDVEIIFKNGDDLRQDMLTLLSLRIMDNVWKQTGRDYGIIPYRCLPTGPMTGFIEVVSRSQTLSKIQAETGGLIGAVRGALNKDSFYDWLQKQCKEEGLHKEEKLSTFISNFTRSVVGYSVATYVLGVGDRHNDNIMMKKDTGQMFHIDFGHFLGNFKTKFGYKREKVKFVLTDDIIRVIEKKMVLEDFKEMCIEAFKTLRRRGNLLITVFAMLLSTGIPQLEKPDDLKYLQESLALTRGQKEAVETFKKGFNEAHAKRFSTTQNWMFHNIAHRKK